MIRLTYLLQIFSEICFYFKGFIKIVRLFLPAVSINGLTEFDGTSWPVARFEVCRTRWCDSWTCLPSYNAVYDYQRVSKYYILVNTIEFTFVYENASL